MFKMITEDEGKQLLAHMINAALNGVYPMDAYQEIYDSISLIEARDDYYLFFTKGKSYYIQMTNTKEFGRRVSLWNYGRVGGDTLIGDYVEVGEEGLTPADIDKIKHKNWTWEEVKR